MKVVPVRVGAVAKKINKVYFVHAGRDLLTMGFWARPDIERLKMELV